MYKKTPNKKDLNPLHYNHKHASLRDFAEHLNLKDVRLRTLQSYYRQMDLVRRHFGSDCQCQTREATGSTDAIQISLKFSFRFTPSAVGV